MFYYLLFSRNLKNFSDFVHSAMSWLPPSLALDLAATHSMRVNAHPIIHSSPKMVD
jgi:hypothetical protein